MAEGELARGVMSGAASRTDGSSFQCECASAESAQVHRPVDSRPHLRPGRQSLASHDSSRKVGEMSVRRDVKTRSEGS